MPLSFSERIVPNVSLTFDDVLLVPAASTVLANTADVRTRLSKNIALNIPLISAPMDSVTEEAMAILMAQLGGIGVLHRNMAPGKQAEKIRKVKRFQSRINRGAMSVFPETSLAEVADIQTRYDISGIPVIDSTTKAVLGIITHSDLKKASDLSAEAGSLMTKENMVTLSSKADIRDAEKIMKEKNVKHLIVVDENQRCVGMITAADLDKSKKSPHAAIDANGCLRVAAAVGVGEEHFDRVSALIDEGVDAIIIDDQHGHHKSVIDMVTFIRRQRSGNVDVIAGNIATSEGALTLIDAGADGVKVGVGVGSTSTPRLMAGVGVPSLTALMDVTETCMMRDIPVIAGSGIRTPGDLAKSLASGASSAMLGTLLMNTTESMSKNPTGTAADIIGDLLEGVRLSMSYTGCPTMKEFRTQPRFIRVDTHHKNS